MLPIDIVAEVPQLSTPDRTLNRVFCPAQRAAERSEMGQNLPGISIAERVERLNAESGLVALSRTIRGQLSELSRSELLTLRGMIQNPGDRERLIDVLYEWL